MRGKKHRSPVLFVRNWSVAQSLQSLGKLCGSRREIGSGRELFDASHAVAGITGQAHAIRSLSGGRDVHLIEIFAAAYDRAFGIYQVPIHSLKAEPRLGGFDLRIALVNRGRVLQHLLPRLGVEFELHQRADRLHWIGMREFVHRLVDVQLLELRLLRRQRFGRSLISAIGREPELVTKSQNVIIDGQKVESAFALAGIAVLLVIPDAYHYPQKPKAYARIASDSAESSLCRVLI